jgi:error-prone DNA polymerase
MVMAGLTGSEAEELRRALSFHRSPERMAKVCVKLRAGLARNLVPPETAERIVQSVQSFALYGFPESHAISFALIAYASCWMKVHRAPEFYAGLLNNQPMGFYSPGTLVKDAGRRGVRIRPVNVVESGWLCAVGADDSIRLGLCYVRGLTQGEGERIVAQRDAAPFASLVDFQLRAALSKTAMRALAKIGAFNGLSEHRRAAQWQVEIARAPDDLFGAAETLRPPPLRPMTPFERLTADYAGTALTTGPHPMALIRERVPHLWRAGDLDAAANGAYLAIGGMVICRQRPGTAKGVVFVSVEDETGMANAIVSAKLFEQARLRISEEAFLEIRGILQKANGVIHVKAREIIGLPVEQLATPASHDFR